MGRCLVVIEALLMVPVLFALWAETVGRFKRWRKGADERAKDRAEWLAVCRKSYPRWTEVEADALWLAVITGIRGVAVVCAVAVWVLHG